MIVRRRNHNIRKDISCREFTLNHMLLLHTEIFCIVYIAMPLHTAKPLVSVYCTVCDAE
jgi:hypothetical protein